MKRFIGMGLVAIAVAIGAGACGDQNAESEWQQPDCSQYKTCGACTWVVGCGWCFSGTGQEGTCLSGPETCTQAGSRWNWNPIGCHVPAEAGVAGDN